MEKKAKELNELLGPEVKVDNMVSAKANSNGSGSKPDILFVKYVQITTVVAAYW